MLVGIKQCQALTRRAPFWCVLGLAVVGGLSACQPLALKADGTAAATEETATAEQFQALRAVKGHFNGGTWNDRVDTWNGEKHQVMQKLQAQILRGEKQAADVRDLFGEPEQIWPESADQYAQLVQRAQWQGRPSGEIWAYYWRGQHDQLLVALKDGKVTAAGWLLAWE
ncbi:MAG: hypothetical protein ABWY06_06735 [Pseudomonas sp.]|uniref:hypothetical protein n=1 Tax=Pseudomonas sp. TaxID=306 RepID=UPI00339AD7A0